MRSVVVSWLAFQERLYGPLLKPPELRCQYKRNAYILANSFRKSKNHTNLLTGFLQKTLKRVEGGPGHGADRGERDRAVEAGNLGATVGGGARSKTETPRRGPDRAVPLPRRSRAVAGDNSRQEPVELSGSMPPRRNRHRLGDAGRGCQLPPCRR